MYTKAPWAQAPGVPMPFGTSVPGTASPVGSLPAGTAAPTASPAVPMYPMQPGVMPPAIPGGSMAAPTGTMLPAPPREESYVENILRMNLGKVGTFYMTYENNSEWNAKIFKGVVEAAGRDHIIISDPATGKRYLLLTLNLDYVTFDEPLTYTLPFGSQGAGMPTRFFY